MYEVVWLRMLGLVFGHTVFGHTVFGHTVFGHTVFGHTVFGHTVFAITTVLAVFMSGLAPVSFLWDAR